MKRFALMYLAAALVMGLTACSREPAVAPDPVLPAASASQSAPGAPSAEPVEVVYYHADDSVEHLVSDRTEVQELSAQALMDLLTEKSVLTAPVMVNHFEQEGTALKMDLEPEFGALLDGTGSTGEYFMMGSVVNTVLENFRGESLELTVNGSCIETGHNIYDEPLGFYE